MRVLVTGARGFIGRSVVRQLEARGIEVTTLGSAARAARLGPANHRVVRRADDADELASLLSGVAPEAILHLAGASSQPTLADLYLVNTLFAASLLQAALRTKSAPSIVLVGTAGEYGFVADADMPVTEDHVCRPTTPYGISKLAQTLHARAVAHLLPVTIARVFNPIGPGMPTSLALGSFADQIGRMGDEGGVLQTGNLDVVRDFIDVEEAARLLVELVLKTGESGEIYNVCSGVGHRLSDVTRSLIECAGVLVRHEVVAARKGNSDVTRFIGSPAKLAGIGLHATAPDLQRLLPAMLDHARANAREEQG